MLWGKNKEMKVGQLLLVHAEFTALTSNLERKELMGCR